MKPRTAVPVLLALVVVAVLAVLLGAVRPATGPADAGRGAVGSALGWLRSRDPVTFEDLARARPGCEDLATRTFAVAGGTTCRVALPEDGAFALCAAADLDAAAATVEGRDFPGGSLGPDDLACEDPVTLDVYDEDMVLSLACVRPGAVCRFAVQAPRS